MITRPLDLQSRLNPPARDFDVVFWVNVGAVALFFALLGSRFVLPPGVAVGVGGQAALPHGGGLVQGAVGTTVVVSYRSANVILFEDGIYTFVELRRQMERHIKAHPGAVVLLRMDGQASLQAFVDVSQMAKELGFSNVVLAAEPGGAEESSKVTPIR